MMPAPMKAQTEVILRPYLSSAYIMNRLAHGTAKFMPSVNVQRLGDGEALVIHDVGQPAAEADGDAEERREADHAGDDADREHPEDEANGSLLVLLAASVVSASFGPAMPMRAEHVERFLAAAVRRQIARRFRQHETKHPDDQRADADDDPHAAPADLVAEGRA